jgi:beta-glucosidase
MKSREILSAMAGLMLFIPVQSQVYLNKTAPVDERVADLLPRLTLSEKLSYIGGYNSFYIRNIDHLSIPAIKMSDGPVGVRNYGNTTAYPAGVLMAASWDTALINKVGQGLGKDARARGVHILLAPGLNIYRIPVNGRNFEYFGEDPYMASEMACAYITGVQSQGVMATAKHFAVNSFERNRFNVSAEVSNRTLQEIYFPAFRASVEKAHVGAIMCAYNKINGTWCSENSVLLNQNLKTNWNFSGFVMSDWGATHNGLPAALGGLDLEMPAGNNMNSYNLTKYINDNTLGVSVIDDKVRRILNELFRFGFFDRTQTLSSIPLENPETEQISRDAARGGIVLLKNDSILPLSADSVRSIAVLGDLADAYVAGAGSSYTSPFRYASVYKGIDSIAGNGIEVKFRPGTFDKIAAYENSVFYIDTVSLQQGLNGEYYDNKTLSGSPVYDSISKHINFYWNGSPGIPGLGSDNFSVRWSGFLVPPSDDDYIFSVSSDDGFRLYIDGNVVMQSWSDHATIMVNKKIRLKAGRNYHVVLEYYENSGTAEIRLGYQSVSSFGAEAIQLAASSDIAVVCAGYGSNYEGEGWDRTFSLPSGQSDFIGSVADANPNTIVILFAGGAVETSPWLDHVKGFIHVFYPGQYGGYALAEIIFGLINPSGKLPFSFDEKWENNPAYKYYSAAGANDATQYSEGLFTGYRYYDTAGLVHPLYPFGFGLSYSTFSYGNLQLLPDSKTDFHHVDVTYEMTNTGSRAGAEVAQLYIHAIEPGIVRPVKELKAFSKVMLQPSETRTIKQTLDLSAFRYYDESLGDWNFEPGKYEIIVGASAEDIRLRDTLSIADSMISPLAVSTFPHDNDSYISLQPEYSICFSRAMNCSGVEFYIRKYSDNSIIDTIEATDLSGCSSRMISFISHTPLEPLTQYFVDMTEGFFTDNLGKSFKGFTNKDEWNFKTFTELPLSFETMDLCQHVLIYPIPAKEKLYIASDANKGKIVIMLTGMDGTLLIVKKANLNQSVYELNLHGIKPGTYVLHIKGDQMDVSEKVVIGEQ